MIFLRAVNQDQKIDQLKLALTWNRADLANSEIFQADEVLTVCKLLLSCAIGLYGAIFYLKSIM